SVLPGRRCNFSGSARKPDDAGIECIDERGDGLGIIPLGIDGYEERLHLLGKRTKLVERRGDITKGGWADVGAVRIAHIYQDPLAVDALCVNRSPRVRHKAEWPADRQ